MIAKRLKKESLLTLVKMAISLAVLWFLIHVSQIKLELLTNFFHQPDLFIIVIFMFLMMVVISAWRWEILNITQGIHLGYLNTLKASYFGAAFNNVLPGAVGGDIVRLYYVFNKVSQKKSKALLAVFFDRIMGFLAVFASIIFAGAAKINSFNQNPELFYLFLTCVIFCLSVLVAFSVLLLLSRRINISAWLNKRFSNYTLAKSLMSFVETVSHFQMTKTAIVKCIFISLGMQSLIVSTVLMIAKIIGLPEINFSDYMIAVGITQIVNLIPITPGGIGLGEMAFANILAILNPGITAAFATIFFAYRVISALAYLPGLIWCLSKFVLLKRRNTIEEEIAASNIK